MITIDDRTGSQELYPLLRAKGVPVQLGRMNFGDIAFLGNGPDGEPISVGIEFKQLKDVLKCITDGRFAGHQLPGMLNSYQQPWLLIQGEYRPRPQDGMLEISGRYGWNEATVGSRRFMYRDLCSWLFTIQIKGGISIASTPTLQATVNWLLSLYSWWQDYDKHHAHLALHTPGPDSGRLRDRAVLGSPPLVRRVAKELPGIGWDKSRHLAASFHTVVELVCASEKELATVPGVGTELARRIRVALDNE